MGRFTLPYAQVLTEAARLGAGYQLGFYQSGTSTPLDTYSDAERTVENANPVIADADGRFGAIFLADQPYKVVLSDEAGALVWTADPVQTELGELGLPVPIAQGGTGASSAAAARTALGLGTAAEYDVGDGADEIPTNSMVSGVPVGGILLWSGAVADIPAGWALCDGGTYSRVDGTGVINAPDLRNRFVVGAGDTYGVGATGGAASVTSGASGALALTVAAGGDHNHGGTEGHTLTVAQIPSHAHGLGGSGVPIVGSGYGYSGASGVTGAALTETGATGGGGSHSHGIPASGTHTHGVTGGDHTHTVATLPPYLALAYIIKL